MATESPQFNIDEITAVFSVQLAKAISVNQKYSPIVENAHNKLHIESYSPTTGYYTSMMINQNFIRGIRKMIFARYQDLRELGQGELAQALMSTQHSQPIILKAEINSLTANDIKGITQHQPWENPITDLFRPDSPDNLSEGI